MLAHYLVLGLSPTATQAEIRQRYLELVRHPSTRPEPGALPADCRRLRRLEGRPLASGNRHLRDGPVRRIRSGSRGLGQGAVERGQDTGPQNAACRGGQGAGERQRRRWVGRATAGSNRRWPTSSSGWKSGPGTLRRRMTGKPQSATCANLFAEIAALRQETRLQNRDQARVGRELARAGALYETVADRAQHREEDLASFEQRVARAAEDRCLRPFLEVRDALVRGREAAGELRRQPRLFRRRAAGTAGVAQGYELALRRFDRVLGGFGVRLLPTVGHPFDARTMRSVETRPGRATRRQRGRRGVSQRFYAGRPGAATGRGSRQPSRPQGVISMEPIIGIDLGTTNSEVAGHFRGDPPDRPGGRMKRFSLPVWGSTRRGRSSSGTRPAISTRSPPSARCFPSSA